MGITGKAWRFAHDPSTLVAASVPGQTSNFKIKQVASKAVFDVLHPRGADGRFIEKGGAVKWQDSKSGMWFRGTVTDFNKDGSVSVTDSSGVKSIQRGKSLYSVQKPVATLQATQFNMVQGQGGSNPGAFYKDPVSGDTWYIKTPGKRSGVSKQKGLDLVASEVAAHKLYSLAGMAVPEVRTSSDGSQFMTKIENSEGWLDLSSSEREKIISEVRKDFVVDAWLANWDAPANDNIRVTEDGIPLRVDTGGSLRYRAQGGHKDLLPNVPELQTMRTSTFGKRLYSGLTKDEEEQGVRKILAISPDDIREAIKSSGVSPGVADDLITRRAFLANHYGFQLPEETPEGKKVIANRLALAQGLTVGSQHPGHSGGAASTSATGNKSVAAPSTNLQTNLATAVRKRAADEPMALAPKSPVWLKNKPTGVKDDTWVIESTTADKSTVTIKGPKGDIITVPTNDIEVLRSNSASKHSKYSTGETPDIDDRVTLPNVGEGKIVSLFPMYAKVHFDNGSKRVVHVKRLGQIKAAPAVAPAKTSGGLYSDPYDGNMMQHGYIKQAENLIRSGKFAEKKFSTTELLPTQAEAFTKGNSSGAGPKDLGPIVAKIGGKLYLLDGHHRAQKESSIKAQYVDLDDLSANDGSTTSQVIPKTTKSNPKGNEFDLTAHDFAANPFPEGYSLTHDAKVTLFSHNQFSPHVSVVLPDATVAKIHKNKFRDLVSVDAEGIKAEKEAAEAKKLAAPAKSGIGPKIPAHVKRQQEVDALTVAEAEKLPSYDLALKYPRGNPDLTINPGDSVFDVKPQWSGDSSSGVYVVRRGGTKVEYLGSNRQSDYLGHGSNADIMDQFTQQIFAGNLVNHLTHTKGSYKHAKAAEVLNPDGIINVPKALSAKWHTARPAKQNGANYNPPAFPSFLTPGRVSTAVWDDYSNDNPKPVFVFDAEKEVAYYAGNAKDTNWSGDQDYSKMLDPSEWVKLTPEQEAYYFTVKPASAYTDRYWSRGSASTTTTLDDSKKLKDVDGNTIERSTETYASSSPYSPMSNSLLTDRKLTQLAKKDSSGQAPLDKLKPVTQVPIPGSKVGLPTSSVSPGVNALPSKIPDPTKKFEHGAKVDGHLNPYVEKKLTPQQALAYKLPTSKDTLDEGKHDETILASRLLEPPKIKNVRTFDSDVPTAFDGTSQRDLLMYGFTKAIGGDANVVRLTSPVMKEFLEQNPKSVKLYRGVKDVAAKQDLHTGTFFAGAGVYGQGTYTSTRKGTAQSTYGKGLSTLTQLTLKPTAVTKTLGDITAEMFDSMNFASRQHYDNMAEVGAAPSLDEIKKGGTPGPKATSMIDSAFSKASSGLGSLSQGNKIQEILTSERVRLLAMAKFYEERGFSLREVTANSGYYSKAVTYSLHFSPSPKFDGKDEDRRDIYIRTTETSLGSKAKSHTSSTVGTTSAVVIDMTSGPANTPTPTYSGSGENFSSSGGGKTGANSGFDYGFAGPKETYDFIKAVNPGAVDVKYPDHVSAGKAAVKNEEHPEVKALLDSTIAKPMKTGMRMNFIQDPGRYALASGVDSIVVQKSSSEDFHIITNRNAMILQA